MKRLLELVAVLTLVSATAGTALAQGSQGVALVEVPGVVEGPGVKVGESTVLHPRLGAEAGVINNVFFEEDSATTAGILRIIAELYYSSLSQQRLAAEQPDDGAVEQGDFLFRAGLKAAYEEYLSGKDTVTSQRDVNLAAEVRAVVFPERTWMFTLVDEFTRQSRPVNYESSSSIDRDINMLRLALTFQPGGRALTGSLRYTNRIDLFEKESHEFANRIQHSFGARANWQWLPVTLFYLDASIGIYDGLGDVAEATKTPSTPVRVALGTSTAITVNTTVNAEIGYTKGFYDEGADYNAVLFSGEFGWRYSPLGRIKFLYRYINEDSINANFYRDHQFKVSLEHQIQQFTFAGDVDVRLRGYRDVIVMDADPNATVNRDDVIFAVNLGAQYHFREWLATTVDYHFVSDQTDFRASVPGTTGSDDPSYVRHELTAGVLAAF